LKKKKGRLHTKKRGQQNAKRGGEKKFPKEKKHLFHSQKKKKGFRRENLRGIVGWVGKIPSLEARGSKWAKKESSIGMGDLNNARRIGRKMGVGEAQ